MGMKKDPSTKSLTKKIRMNIMHEEKYNNDEAYLDDDDGLIPTSRDRKRKNDTEQLYP